MPMMLLRRASSSAVRAATVNPPFGRRRPSTSRLATVVSLSSSNNAGVADEDAAPIRPTMSRRAMGGAIRCLGDTAAKSTTGGSAPAGAAATGGGVGGGLLANLIDRYSIRGQQRRIVLAERLFRAAQRRSTDPDWFSKGSNLHIDRKAFRPPHALLTMHVWFLHRRLLLEQQQKQTGLVAAPTGRNSGGVGSSTAATSNPLLVQEELFEILWHDTRARIRAAGVQELAVSKNLKDVQNLTFQMCMAFDHAVEMESRRRRRDDVGLVLWTHLYLSNDDVPDVVVDAVADYVLDQYDNICFRLPGNYWAEGRVGWVPIPSVNSSEDTTVDSSGDEGEVTEEPPSLPIGWYPALTDSGETYYWNEDTMESSWERPPSTSPPPRSPTTVEAA